jgi:hypothetical protein
MSGQIPDFVCPTGRHAQYLRRVSDYCREKRIGLGLLGSMAAGKAGKFSDIDLALSGKTSADDLRRIAEDFETPIMGFFTVGPRGVLTVAYPRGFCVEVGVRKTIARGEPTGLRLLLPDGFATGPVPELVDIAAMYRPEFVIAHDGLRILYKSVLKYLGGRHEAAAALLGELGPGPALAPAGYARRWRYLFDGIARTKTIGREALEEFEWLFSQIVGV